MNPWVLHCQKMGLELNCALWYVSLFLCFKLFNYIKKLQRKKLKLNFFFLFKIGL